jgi:hypothetical protein
MAYMPHLLSLLLQLLSKRKCCPQSTLVVAEQIISCKESLNRPQAAYSAQQLQCVFQALPHIAQQLFLQAHAAGKQLFICCLLFTEATALGEGAEHAS